MSTGIDIVEEYEKIKDAERDQKLLGQDMNSKKILSADRFEDLLCFPIDSQENLRKTDRIYMTDDKKRLLLIREFGDMKSSKSASISSTTISSSQKGVNKAENSEEKILTKKSPSTTGKFQDSKKEDGCVVNFKVFVDINQNRTHQIHVQAYCPDFAPSYLDINGKKFLNKQ